MQYHEMFDMERDPWQLVNVYPNYLLEQPAMVAALANLTRHMYGCQGAACR